VPALGAGCSAERQVLGEASTPRDGLGIGPFLGGGNITCREVADTRLTLLSRRSAAAKFQLIPG